MISIDTDILESLVGAMTAANDAISEAVDVLNRITIHNDWGCKEKDAINDYTTTNKAKINTLSQQSQSLLNAISSAANDFITTESSISDLFQSVESIISNIFSITPAIINGLITGKTDTSDMYDSTNSNWLHDIMQDILPSSGVPEWEPVHVPSISDIINDNNILPDVVPICRLPNLESFTSQNLISPLSVCNFNDISLE